MVRVVSGGEISGRTFYVAAILGAPALWAEAREAVREKQILTAARRGVRAARRAFSGRLRFALDGGAVEKAEALSLLCPLISKAMDEQTALEAAVIDPSEWRHDPSISVRHVQQGQVYARRTIPAILDGEPIRLSSPASIRFIPRAFKALEPRRDVGEPRV